MSKRNKRQRTSSQWAKRIEAWNKAFRRFLPLSISRLVSPARERLTKCFETAGASKKKRSVAGTLGRTAGTEGAGLKTDRLTQWLASMRNLFGWSNRLGDTAVNRYEMHLETLEDRTLLSGSGFEVYDGNTEEEQTPVSLAVVNDAFYFVQADKDHGLELFRRELSDGSITIIEDLNPGKADAFSSTSFEFHLIGNDLYFPATDGTNGNELRKLDTTTNTISLVADLESGTGSSFAGSLGFASFGDDLYFNAFDTANGFELRKLDTTTGIVSLVADIEPGSGDSFAGSSLIFQSGDSLYFNATDSIHGQELWQLDTMTDVVNLVADIEPGSGGSNPRSGSFFQFDEVLYFTATDSTNGNELRKLDTSTGQVSLVADLYTGSRSSFPGLTSGFAQVGDKLYFSANDPSNGGWALRVLDTTNDSITMAAPVSPSSLFHDGNDLYFSGVDTASGNQFRKFDTTTGLLTLVSDVDPASNIRSAQNFVKTGDEIYFSAFDSTTGYELWSLNTSTGTSRLVVDLVAGSESSNAGRYGILLIDGELFFTANDSEDGFELRKLDPATDLVESIPFQSATDGSDAGAYGGFILVNDNIYFTGDDSENGNELRKLNLSTGESSLVADIELGDESSYAGEYGGFIQIGGELYFTAEDSENGGELRKLDLTTGTVSLVADINEGSRSSEPGKFGGFVAVGSNLYFTAEDSDAGEELRKLDTLTGEITLVEDIQAGDRGSDAGRYSGFTAVGSEIYFTAEDDVYGDELRRLDTITGEVTLVTDLVPGNNGSSPGEYGGFIQVGNSLYFTADSDDAGSELHKLDLATGVVSLVADIQAGSSGSGPGEYGGFALVGDLLFFSAYDEVHGYELRQLDTGTGIVSLVADIAVGSESSFTSELGGFVVVGSDLYFTAFDEAHGNELRKLDTNTGAVSLVADIAAGVTSSNAGESSGFIQSGKDLFFNANDDINGDELRKLDTKTGIVTTIDIRAGFGGSGAGNEGGFLQVGDFLYFSARTEGFGTEIVRISTNDAPVAQNDAVTTNEYEILEFDVFADNGSGIDSDDENNIVSSLTTLVTSPAKGVLTELGDGRFTFDPNGEFEFLSGDESETVTFSYQIEDVYGETSQATVSVTVTGVADDEIVLDPIEPVGENEVAIVSGTFIDGDRSGENILTIEWNDENAAADESVGTFELGATELLSMGDSFQSTTDSSTLDIVSVDAATGEVGFWISGHEFADDSLSPEDPSIPDPTPIIVSITNSFSVTQSATLELLDEKAAGWNVVKLGEDPVITTFRQIYGNEDLLVGTNNSRNLFTGSLNPRTFSGFQNSVGNGFHVLGLFDDKIIVNSRQTSGAQVVSAVSLVDGTVTKLGDVQAVVAHSGNPSLSAVPGKGYFIFVGSDSFGKELWRSDGTPENTFRVTDLYPGSASGVGSSGTATVFNDEFYFLGRTNGSVSNGLYKTDGTREGTVAVAELNRVEDFVGIFDDRLYFLGTDLTTGKTGLFATNGSADDTVLVVAADSLSYTEAVPSSYGFYLVGSERSFNPETYNYEFSVHRIDHYQVASGSLTTVYDAVVENPAATSIEKLTPFQNGVAFWEIEAEEIIFDEGVHSIKFVDLDTGSVSEVFRDIRVPSPANEISQIAVLGDSIAWINENTSYELEIFASYGSAESTTKLGFDPAVTLLNDAYIDAGGRLYFGMGNGIDAGQLFSIVQTPVADLGQNSFIVTEGDAFVLDASRTLDPENAIVSLEWDLNYDGQTFDVDATGDSVPFETIDGPAFSTVALRVTDAWGNTSVDTQSILVRNAPPAITSLEDTSAALGEAVALSAVVTDQGTNDTFSLEWNLGDGTIVNDVANVTHTYAAEGEYFASLTATDNDGGVTVQEFRVVIGPAVELQLQNIMPIEGDSGVITVSFVDDITVGENVVIPLNFSGTASRDDFRLFTDEALTIEAVSESITIVAGERSGQIYVRFLDDAIDEFEESLNVEMQVPSNASLAATAESTFNVTDNDPEPTVYLTGSSQILDESIGTVPVIARLSQVSGKDVIVDIGFGGTAVSGEDYLAPENQILIRAGELQAGLAVEIVDDELGESAEQLVVSINGVTNASQSTDPLEPLSATHIISANDAPTIQFASVLQDISETAGEFRVKVTLSNPSDSAVTAQVDLSGTAIRGSDYEYESPFQVSFAAGDVEQTLTFSLTDDFEAESDETIIATLSGVTGALDGATLSHLARVIDDENLKVSLSTSAKSVWEDDDQFFVNARLSKATSVDVIVPVSFSSQLQSGSEYFVSSNQIVIRAGETNGQLAVILDADNQTNGSDRSFRIAAADPENATLTGLRNLKVSILDNDPIVSFVSTTRRSSSGSEGSSWRSKPSLSTDIEADEDDGNIAVTLYLDRAINRDVTVPILYSSPTMTSRDYVRGPSSVTVRQGDKSVSFNVRILDDTLDEPLYEYLTISLGTPSRGRLASNRLATKRVIAVKDNDGTPAPFWSLPSTTIREGETRTVAPEIVLSKRSETEVTVKLFVTGSATQNSDYNIAGLRSTRTVDNLFGNPILTKSITFQPGEVRKRVNVKILDDGDYEGLERIFLQIASGGGSPDILELPINDNESRPRKRQNDFQKFLGKVGDFFQDVGESIKPTYDPRALFATVKPFDGYASGAKLFFDANLNQSQDFVDANGNGILDEGELLEPSAESDYDGQVVVPDLSAFDLNGNGFIDANEGQFVVRGGEDISTGGRFKVPLTAPVGYSVVSPLSTLVQAYATLNSADVNAAESQIASAFGLTDSGYLRGDLIQLASQGDLVAATAFGTSAQVYAVVTQVGEFVSGLSNGQVPVDIAGSLAFQDMVEKLSDPNGQLDLAEPFVIESIIRGVATRVGLESVPNESLQAAVNAIVGLNSRIQALEVVEGREYVESVASIQEIANVQLAEALNRLAKDEVTPTEFASEFNSVAIDSRIEALPARNVVIPYIVSDDVTIVEGDSGEQFAEFNVGLTTASNLPVTVNYATQDASATAGEDYEATSGQLTWAAGDTTIHKILVPILADVDFEGNELFQLVFTDPVNAETLETIALGAIVDNDSVVIATDDVEAGTEYRLDSSNGEVLLLSGEIVLFNGTLGENQSFRIDATGSGPKDLFVSLRRDATLPDDGILFVGDGLTSRLTIESPTATDFRHVRTGLTSGYIEADGQRVRYQGVVESISETAPMLSGLPAENPQVGDDFTLTGTATNLDPDVEASYQWNLIRNGASISTGNNEVLPVSIELSGSYSVEFSVLQEGRPNAITSYEFEVEIPAPIAVDDQIIAGEDSVLVLDAANSLLQNDTFEGEQPLTGINGNPSQVGSELLLDSGALLTVQTDGSLRYDPRDAFNGLAEGELGRDSFTYTITVGEFSRTATVQVEIIGKNDPPRISLNSVLEIVEGESVVVTGAFTDPDSHGDHTLTINWNDPNADFGEELATFEMLDVSQLSVGDVVNSVSDSTIMEILAIDAETGEVAFAVTGHVYLDDGEAPGNATTSDSIQVQASIREGNLSSLPQIPTQVGIEFQINTTTARNQRTAAFNGATNIATDAAGNFVVVWSSFDQDGSDWGLFGRRYNADGTTAGNEFQINSETERSQIYSAVAMKDDGRFVVTWSSFDQDGDTWGIYAQMFDAAGDKIGGEFRVNSQTADSQIYPTVAMDADGQFVVTWSSENQDGSGWGVFGQRFDLNGAKLGTEFRVNSEISSNQLYQSTAMDKSGNFVVTWSSLDQDGSDYGIYGQRFDQFGDALGSEFRINRFTTDKQTYSSVAMDQDGNFMVVWSSLDQDGSEWGIFGKRYQSDGSAMGGEFQINSFTDSAQIYPTIAMDADGNSVVTWSSIDQDGDSWGIFGQRFDSNGFRFGSEFQINTVTDKSQLYSSVAIDQNGKFIVVWESEEQDGDSFGMFGQRFEFGKPPVRESLNLVVQNAVPIVDVGLSETLTPDNLGELNRAITFTDKGTLDSHSVTIDFGDGSETELIELSSSDLKIVNLNHVYEEQGTFIVTITVGDDDLGFGMGSFEVNVQLNDPPVAVDDSIEVDEDSLVTFDVLADNGNGADFDAQNNIDLSLTQLISGPAKGNLTNNQDGTFTFDPNREFESLARDESEVDSFIYQIEDSFGETSEATVTITIVGANDAPILSLSENEVAVKEGNVALNSGQFSDVDQSDTVDLDSSIGAVTDNGDGTWTWAYDGEDDLATTVVITASDEDGGKTSIEFDLTVENVAPTLEFETTNVVINEGDSTSKLITASDVPADTIQLNASIGTINSNGDGTWTWDYDGVDDLATTVVITAADEDGGETSTEFDLTVENVAPAITFFNSSHHMVCESSADESVRISGQFEDPGTDVYTATIDWGDGTIEVIAVDQLTKGFAGTHEYQNGGIFEVTITVEDDDGSIDVATTQAVSQGVGLVDGVLFVIGSDRRDRIQMHYQSRDNQVWVRSSIGSSRRRWQSFDASQVTAIKSYLCGGNDLYTSGGYRNSRYDVSIAQWVDGGDGNDRIYGGKGDDFLIGGGGNDLIAGYGGDDVIEGNAGNDWIFGGRGNDVLLGHSGNDYLVGGHGNDALSGGHGNDCLYGERGSDILIGGFGRDWIIGGSGADVIVGGTTSNSEDYESLQLAIISWSNRDEGETFEQLGEVIDDDVRDFLIGGRGPDTIEGGVGDWEW